MSFFTRMMKRDFDQKERDHAASTGAAMSDGSFPIYSEKDVHNAVDLMGASKHPKDEVKAHIKTRAKAIGAEAALPKEWKDGT